MAEDKKPGSPASEPAPKFSKEDFESLKKLGDLLKLAGALKEEIKGINGSYEEFVGLVGQETATRLLKNLNDDWEDLNSSLEGSVNTLRNAQLEFSLLAKIGETSYSKLSDGAKQAKLTQDEIKFAAKEVSKAISGISSGYQSVLEELNGVNDLGEKELENIVKKSQKDVSRLETMLRLGAVNKEQEETVKEQIKAAIKLQEYSEARLKLEKAVEKQMGITGSLLKGTQSILSKFGGMDKHLNLEETTKKLRNLSLDGKSSMEIMKEGAKDVGKSLIKAVSDPLVTFALLSAAMKSMVTLALEYQTKMFEAAKTLGVNVDQAEQMQHHFLEISASNTKMGLDAEQLNKTYFEMSNNLGVMVNQDKDFLAQSAAISRNFGLSAQQMELIQMRSKETGKSVKETFSNTVGTGKAMAQSLGISMTEKQIMEGISKNSATVFMNFKGNVSELTKAVVTATKFGTTLNEINAAGNQMLNFQDSIGKEFEAQLLTGKNIDLSMARQYALTGDTKNLMTEITKNIGSQQDYAKMNVLQQQSLAEAVGMSKEQLDEMFRKQQMINTLGKDANLQETDLYEKLVSQGKSRTEIAKLMGEEATARASEASAQQQMAAAMKNLHEFAGSIAAAFTPITVVVQLIADGINAIAKSGTVVKVIFGSIAAILSGMLIYMTLISAKKARDAVMDARALTRMQLTKLLKEQEAAADQKSAIATQQSANNSAREVASEVAVLGPKTAGAVADSVSAGSAAGAAVAGPTLGLGTIPMILAVAGTVLTAVGMFGGLSGFGGGGGGAAASMPISTGGINPMNTAAANANTMRTVANQNSQKAAEIKLYQQNYVEPVTGKVMTKVKAESYNADGQTGSNAVTKIGEDFTSKRT